MRDSVDAALKLTAEQLKQRAPFWHDGASHCRQITPTSTIMDTEASYVCDHCGEEIVVPIDPSAGASQEYVEDCPVCCHPNVIHVEIDEDGHVRVWGAAEQDR